MCLVQSRTRFAIFWSLDFKFQFDILLSFVKRNLDVFVFVKENPSENLAQRRILAFVADTSHVLMRYIHQDDLFSLIELNSKVLTCKFGSSSIKHNITGIVIESKDEAFLKILRLLVKSQLNLRSTLSG